MNLEEGKVLFRVWDDDGSNVVDSNVECRIASGSVGLSKIPILTSQKARRQDGPPDVRIGEISEYISMAMRVSM